MKKTAKILALVLVLVMMFAFASMFTASAATPEKLYLTPNANWKKDNARFAAYFFGNGEKWVSMTYNSELGVYEVTVPAGYPSVIFCRMNPNASANNWNNKWNQTADLTVPTNGTNHYTVKEGTWDKGGGTWGTLIIDSGECQHKNTTTEQADATCTTDGYKKVYCSDCEQYTVNESYPATGHTYSSGSDDACNVCSAAPTWTVAGSGAHLGTEWDTGNTANDMTYADGVYTKVYTNVAAGSYALKVVRDHDWGTAYPGSDKAYTVSTSGSTVTVTLKGTTVDIKVEAPHTHSWSDATCTEPQKCECGETQGEALGHDMADATCTAPSTCKNGCGLTEGEATGHTYGSLKVTPATCTEDAYITIGCNKCGGSWSSANNDQEALDYLKSPVGQFISLGKASHNLADAEGKAATCTEAGYSAHKACTRCDHTEGKEGIPVVDHVDEDPRDHECDVCGTCTSDCVDENKNHKCDICDDVMSKCADNDKNHFCDVCGVQNSHCIDIPPYDHNCDWCGEKMSEHNYVKGVCDVCGAEDPNYAPPHVHDYEAVVTAPTCTAAGYTTYTCACGDTYTGDEKASLGHTDANPCDHECDVCGLCVSDCTDANKNHKCDICNDVMSKCADDDKDHFCDVCGVQNSHCIDIPPYDHNCDWCGEKMSEHNYVEGVCDVCGAEDPNYAPPHVHAHEAVVTAPTCTAAGYTTYTCACGDTYTGDEVAALGHTWKDATCTAPKTCSVCSATEGEKLGHVDANLDISCDREGCTSKVAPKADSTLSNFTANNLGSKLSVDASYYVEGTIVEVLDARNGIFLIDDGTGETFYFRLPKDAAGNSHASWAVKLTLGDKVRLYGKINKYSTSTAPNGQYWPAMQAPTVEVLEQHPHVFGEPTCTEPGYCVCGQSGPVALGHVDADASGLCDVCNWNMKALLEEVKIPITAITGTDAMTNSSGLWKGTVASVLVTKGEGTSFCAVATYDHMRLYNKNDMTITVSEGNKIISLTFVATGSSYVDELEAYIKSAGYEYTIDGLEVTIAIDSLESVVIVNTSGKIARITAVKVVYIPAPAHEHSYDKVVTAPTCTAAGYTTYTCACGDTYTGDEKAALGHTWTDATCTAPKTCSVCSATEGEALGHTFVEGKCECGEEDPNYVPPHEHNFVAGKCECGEEDPNYVPPHEHNFVEGKCECGEEDPNYVPPHEHNFVEGKCECGETDPNYVPPHEHNFVEGKCECGETDPDYVAPDEPGTDEPGTDEPGTDEPGADEPAEGDIFATIMKIITDLLDKIVAFFKNLLKF